MKSRGILVAGLPAIAVAILLVATLACGTGENRTSSKKPIVVTYSLLGAVVKDLVGNKADVKVLAPNGVDPHEWEPSAKDTEAINKADLVVQNGLGLEAGMQGVLDNARNSGVKFFTAGDYISVRKVGPGEGIPSDDPDQEVGAVDPHLWMDPVEMKAIANALAEELDREFGLDIAGQAAEMGKQIDSLDREIRSVLAVVPQQDRKLVTGHESLGYFARRYDFQLIGAIIPSLSTQAGVSAGELAALKKTILENKVKAIFTELGTPDAVARAIGDETGVKVVQLNAALLPADGSYFTFMRDIAREIAEALR